MHRHAYYVGTVTLQASNLSFSAHWIDGMRMLSFLFPYREREKQR